MQSNFINQLSKEYGRRLLPSGSHKVSKKQLIINRVINKARRLAKSPLTGKQANALQRFASDRLSTHGRLGYQFKMVVDYHKQLIPASDINSIAAYALESNFIKY